MEKKEGKHGDQIKNFILTSLKEFQNNILEASKAFENLKNDLNINTIKEAKETVNYLESQNSICRKTHQEEINSLVVSTNNFDYCTNLTQTLISFENTLPSGIQLFEDVWACGATVMEDLEICQSESGFSKITCMLNVYSEVMSDMAEYQDEVMEYVETLNGYVQLITTDFFGCVGWNSETLNSKINSVKNKMESCLNEIKSYQK